MIHITKHKYYAEGSRPSHLLALMLKQQEAKRAIPAIKCVKRGVVSSTEEINETFRDYFKDLYTGGCVPSEDDFTKLISGLDLPSLSEEDTIHLDAPITLDELLQAVKGTNKGRTPGIDGIFSKVLTSRFETIIGKIVSTDQTGFIKGRLVADNIRRLLHILSATNKIPPECGLLFLDAEKAFDRLEWPYNGHGGC